MSETRPITLKNTDNKILAGVVNNAIAPVVAASCSHVQSGFVKGRNFLNNVLAIDVDGRNLSSEFVGACVDFLSRK